MLEMTRLPQIRTHHHHQTLTLTQIFLSFLIWSIHCTCCFHIGLSCCCHSVSQCHVLLFLSHCTCCVLHVHAMPSGPKAITNFETLNFELSDSNRPGDEAAISLVYWSHFQTNDHGLWSGNETSCAHAYKIYIYILPHLCTMPTLHVGSSIIKDTLVGLYCDICTPVSLSPPSLTKKSSQWSCSL